MKNKKLVIAFVLVSFIAIFLLHTFTAYIVQKIPRTKILVKRVIDGDTIVSSTGTRIRLLGINTPEKEEFYHDEATEFLKNMIENKTVEVESDIIDTDRYGRLLRYIFLGDKFINSEMVKNGFAHVYLTNYNLRYRDKLLNAQEYAKIHEFGIWKHSKYYGCIKLDDFSFSDKNEFVKFKNFCNFPVYLDGWYLKDESSRHKFKFNKITLGSDSSLTLHTGYGYDNLTDIFWNHKPIWNNEGDTVFLYDDDNLLVFSYSYR